jgi:hypothetical protein
LPDILVVQVPSLFYQFLPVEKRFTYAAAFGREVILCAEKIGNRSAGGKYTVSEACVRHWRSMKTKLFSRLKNRKSSVPRKGRNPETVVSVLEYLKYLRNKELPITKEALMSKAK